MSQNPSDIQPDPSTPAPATNAKPRRRRRRWPWVLGGLGLLLFLLVALAPTIASLGVVRSMLLPRVSSAVAPNGKLQIDDWSFGWFSGQQLEGIRILDDQNAVVAHLNVSTGASLASLLRGNLDIGQTTVTGDFDIRIDPETGRVNLLHILGSEDSPAKLGDAPAGPGDAETAPAELPALSGLVLVDVTGTVSSTRADDANIPFTKIEQAKLKLDLSSMERGIDIDGVVKADVGGKPASLMLKGSADAIENGQLLTDPDKIAADLGATIDRVDLTLLNSVLSAFGMGDTKVAGTLKGSLAIKLEPGAAASITSGDGLGIHDLVYTGAALKGDTLRLKRTDLKLNVTRNAGSGMIEIADSGLNTDLASLKVDGTVPQIVVQNLIDKKSPGGKGMITIRTAAPDFARLASMLPNTIALKDGTTVTGGGLQSTTVVEIGAENIALSQSASLEAAGTADGKPIRLEPTTLTAAATFVVREGQVIDERSISRLSVDLAAPFARIKGSGVPREIAFDGSIDATRAKQNLSQFVDLGENDFGGIINFALNTRGLPTDATEPLAAKLTFDTQNLTFAQGGETMLQDEKFTGTVDLMFRQTPESKIITFKQLKIGTESGLVGVWTTGESLWVALFDNGAIGGEGELHVRAKLDRLAAMFAKDVDPSMKLKRGTLDSVLTLASDTAKNEYRINVRSDLSKLDVGDLLANETLRMGIDMFVPSDFSASRTWFEVASNFVAVKGEADLKLSEALPIDLVQTLKFEGEVPSLAKAYGLAQSLIGQAAGAAQSPLPPLRVEGGTLAFSGSLQRDAATRTSAVTLNVPAVSGVSMSRGDERFRLTQPATISLAASITDESAGQTMKLKQVLLRQLDAQLPGIASLTMAKPVSITNLGADQPDAQGEVRASANLAPLGELLGVLNGTNPIPYAGKATMSQSISTTSGQASLAGQIAISELTPTAKDAAPLPIRRVELSNDLAADLKNSNLAIRTVKVVAPDLSGTPLVEVNGSLIDWSNRQELKDVRASFDLNWEQVWKLLGPIVDPEGAMAVAVAGDYRSTWTASGRLSDMTTVNAAGDVSFQTLQAMGLNFTQKGPLSIPLLVKNGRTQFARSDGTPMADVTVNDGTMKLAGIELALQDMTLTAPRKHQLLRNVQLNSVLANQLGQYASVLFAKSSKATGTLDVRILSMSALPITDLAHMNDSQGARIAFSVRDLYLDGYVPKALETIADLGTGGLRAEIKDASINIVDGRLKNDVTFTIVRLESQRDRDGKPREVRQNLPLGALGNIDLATLKLFDTRLNFPTALIKSDELQKYLGDSLVIPVTGFANAPQLKPEKIIEEAVKQRLRDPGAILGDLIKDRQPDASPGDEKKSDVEKAADIIGGLLGGKKKDERKEEPPAEPRRQRD